MNHLDKQPTWKSASLAASVLKPMIHSPPADGRILFYRRDRSAFGFLSNFHECSLQIGGFVWPHVEAYYQAQKSHNPAYTAEILRNSKPSWSKKVGDSRLGNPSIARQSWFAIHPEDLRPDWDKVKLDVMKTALTIKFTQHEPLKRALLDTHPAELVEDSDEDSFWGVGADGNGQNLLGRMLMEVRTVLDGEKKSREC
jgi:ribA/ribD-fused uncharacterized protein